MTALQIKLDSLEGARPGFGARVVGSDLLLPKALYELAQAQQLLTVEELISYLYTFPSDVAARLRWPLPRVEKAIAGLVESLRGHVAAEGLEIPTPPSRSYGVRARTPDPKVVGAQIRALLLSLRAPGHDPGPWGNYSTDDLRREALDHAGICWLAPGEMAPGCCCDWSVEKPDGPRKILAQRLAPKSGG